MNLDINAYLHGFRVSEKEYIDELSGTLYQLVYEKTGTRLIWLDNGNENKLFSITIRTTPSDDTGVFHIIEHTVLNGSEKYPVKDPFVYLMKGSMNTFLNAMTFPDKTMYPVSSRNDKDFRNLVSVYLDSVFRPNLLRNRNIFLQEGWHYEHENGDIKYNGVVYNEMKGATDGPERIEEDGIMKLLFPDTAYGFNSGGDPASIPELSYEKYVDTYRKFYHPSNSNIYLDGSVDMEDILTLLDSYLCQYEEIDTSFSEIAIQEPLRRYLEMLYPINENDTETDHRRVSYGKIIGTYMDKDMMSALDIITQIIAGSNEGLLTQKILKDDIAEDLIIYGEPSVKQPYLQIIVQNVKDRYLDDLDDILRSYLEDIGSRPFDKELLESAVNNMEFKLFEPQEPSALQRAVNIENSLLYDSDNAALYLRNRPTIDFLKRMIDTDYFDVLFRKVFLSDDFSKLVLIPSRDFADINIRKEKEKLDTVRMSMSDEQLAVIDSTLKDLRLWQDTEDSEEDRNTIPRLGLEDIDSNFSLYNNHISEIEGVPYVFHRENTNGILYIRMLFDLSDYTLPELCDINMLTKVFSDMGTSSHSAFDLQTIVERYLGNLSIKFVTKQDPFDPEKGIPQLQIYLSVMEDNLEKAADIVREILFETVLDTDKIGFDLMQMDEMQKISLIENGDIICQRRACADLTASHAITEMTVGYSSFSYIHGWTGDIPALTEMLRRTYDGLKRRTFVKRRLTVTLTSMEDRDMSAFTRMFEEGSPIYDRKKYFFNKESREAIIIPSQTAYSAKAYSLHKMGLEYNGAFAVTGNILSLEYLWNLIRVHGGAYGTGIGFKTNGTITSNSYRDPDPIRSLAVMDHMSDFLSTYTSSVTDITQYIISTIAGINPLLSPSAKGTLGDVRYFENIGIARDLKILDEIRTTGITDIRKHIGIVERFQKEGSICLIGNRDIIKGEFSYLESIY